MMRPTSRMGVGVSSITLLLMAVCLTVFGVLALLSARNDRALTRDTIESVQSYYLAETEAQRILAESDALIQTGDFAALAALQIAQEGQNAYAFAVQAQTGHTLDVKFAVEDGHMRITRYRYCAQQAETTEPTGLNLFQPGQTGGN